VFHRLPLAILIAYVVLATIYSAAVPIFEAPDENYHFAFIQRLTQSLDLPVQDPAVETPWYQEGSQPPLYYLLGSLIARLVPADHVLYPLEKNPHPQIGIGLARINRNFFLHGAAEAFPWRGLTLQFHLIRLMSVGFGVVTVYAVYRTARLAVPEKPVVAYTAMAFTAFNPMFIFVSSSINNDNLVTMFSTLASWQILAIVREGYTLRRVAIFAIVIALASLSKLSGLTLYVVAAAAFGVLLFKQRITWKQVLVAGALLLGVFAILAGWWYVRNWQLYSDPTGLNRMIAIIFPRKEPYTIKMMLDEMQGLRISFWALFGWFNVIGPDWFLVLMDTLTAVALIGGVVSVVRKLRAGQYDALMSLGVLGLQFLVTFVSLINWTRLTPGTQGRLLFPAMSAIATLVAVGWFEVSRLIRPPRTPSLRSGEGDLGGEVLPAIPVAIMLGVAILSIPLTILPAYAPPPTVALVPDDATQVDVSFEKIKVVGFRVERVAVLPGGVLPVTIYYQGEPDPRNLSLYLTALNRDDRPVGKIDSYPGGGNLPTSAMQPGVIYADTYLLPIGSETTAPMQPKIEFGWWNFKTKQRIQPVRSDGTRLDALILRGGSIIAAAPAPTPATVQQIVFSGALRLNGYALSPADATIRAGEQIEVSLNWEALSWVYEDFTVFVHAEAVDGNAPMAQGDGPPLNGHYPTSAWLPGHPFVDTHVVKINTPGTYRLVIGLYRSKDNSRLPASTGGDSVVLQTQIVVR
jgi:4-amino-4-deoxy-L-arabinose transferase-like glycosyltransferase